VAPSSDALWGRPREELLAAYDRDLRAEWVMPEARREVVTAADGGVAWIRWIRPEVHTSTVLYADLQRLEVRELEDLVDRHVDDERARGLTGYWKLHDHDAPPDLGRILASRGYVSDDDPGDEGPVMLRGASEGPIPERGSASAAVRRVGPESFGHVVDVEQRIYGGDFGWLGERLTLQARVPGFLSVYVAYVEGVPVGAGWTYLHPAGRFAVLRGGGTVPERRRQGLYSALLGARLREADDRGFRYAVVEPSPMNVPVVGALGFATLTRASDLKRAP
jgi:GNAT superfamily N-acetyltransferase